MALWKKIVVVSVVLMMVAAGATAYILYKSGLFGPSYGDMDGYYLDLEGAAEIGICNVNMGSQDISDAVLSNTLSFADSKGDAAYEQFAGSNNRPVSHDRYLVAPSRVHSQLDHMQSKLFKGDGNGHRSLIKVYKDMNDLHNKNEAFDYKQSIVYVEDAGKFILITYYKHDMADVWNHLNYHGSFWSRDVDYSSALIDKETGRVHTLTGLWCGCTFAKYGGTNDIMPSIDYVGQVNGKEAFLINIERNMENRFNQSSGMFYDKRGLIAIDIVDGQVVYEEIIAQRNAGYGVDTDSEGNHISAWDEGAGYLGFEFDFYRNGVIHYYHVYGYPNNDAKKMSYKDYLWFPDTGESIEVDSKVIKECDGYICSSVTYKNKYFPTECTRYKSDGTTDNVVFSAEDSYRIASEASYPEVFSRETVDGNTVLYASYVYEYQQHGVDVRICKVTLYPELYATTEKNLFDRPMFDDRATIGSIVEYDHRLFYKFERERMAMNLAVNIQCYYTGFVLHDNTLFMLEENNTLGMYDLSTGEAAYKQFDKLNELLYIYVDYDDTFVLEGSSDHGYSRAEMKDDGTFRITPTELELDVVKKIKL